MTRYVPESHINDSTIEHATQTLRHLTDEELQRQSKQLVEQANSIPMELADLAARHKQLAADIQNATLLGTLTGEAGTDQSKLEAMAEAVNNQRRQRRIDLERVTTMGKLVDAEINYRAQNRIYRAVSAQIDGWKQELPEVVIEAKEAVAKAIASYCHVGGGMTPQNIVVKDFVPNVLGDVQKRASEVFSEMKLAALDQYDHGGEQQALTEEKQQAAVKAGRERKQEEALAFQEKRLPNVPRNTESV
jgi:hypothetical protein